MHPYLTFAGLAIACSVASFGLLFLARNIFNLFMLFVYMMKEWIGRYQYKYYHWWFNPKGKPNGTRINGKFVQMNKPLGIQALNDGKMVEDSLKNDIK